MSEMKSALATGLLMAGAIGESISPVPRMGSNVGHMGRPPARNARHGKVSITDRIRTAENMDMANKLLIELEQNASPKVVRKARAAFEARWGSKVSGA